MLIPEHLEKYFSQMDKFYIWNTKYFISPFLMETAKSTGYPPMVWTFPVLSDSIYCLQRVLLIRAFSLKDIEALIFERFILMQKENSVELGSTAVVPGSPSIWSIATPFRYLIDLLLQS